MAVSAVQVKELRERTGAGMMECKKALVESNGDIEVAIESMRKKGQAKAVKKAGRIAAEGLVVVKLSDDQKQAVILEVNSETDFVAKDDNFVGFTEQVATAILANKPSNIEELQAVRIGNGETVEDARKALIAKIGENIQIRRFVYYQTETANIASYVHGSRIAVIVELENANAVLGKDIAMHIAASKPMCVSEQQVPQDVLNKEREIFTEQAQSSNKPANIIEKMVNGRLQKYLSEITLLGQGFIKDPDTKVGKLLKQQNANVIRFERFEVGEGIEKKNENFAEEVMAQVKDSK